MTAIQATDTGDYKMNPDEIQTELSKHFPFVERDVLVDERDQKTILVFRCTEKGKKDNHKLGGKITNFGVAVGMTDFDANDLFALITDGLERYEDSREGTRYSERSGKVQLPGFFNGYEIISP